MGRKNDYLDDELLQPSALSGAAGGILRITLLFGSAAVALALIIAPLADRGSQAVVDARVLAEEYATGGVTGLRRYEDQRRAETAEVVAANRDMHRTSARTAADLDRVTTKYRNDTARSNR